MKNKFAAAALTGALALSGTAVAEAAPAEQPDKTITSTTESDKDKDKDKGTELTAKEKWENIKDQVGRTELSSGAGIAAQAGLVTLVFSIAAMIAAFNKVELTWPGDPHHIRV